MLSLRETFELYSFKWIPCWGWHGKCTGSYLIEKSSKLLIKMAIYHSRALIGFRFLRPCGAVNWMCPFFCSSSVANVVISCVQLQLIWAEKIRLYAHAAFHWQLMFVTTSRKKNSQVALCKNLGADRKTDARISGYFELFIHEWACAPSTDPIRHNPAEQRATVLLWNFYFCQIVRFRPNKFYPDAPWD